MAAQVQGGASIAGLRDLLRQGRELTRFLDAINFQPGMLFELVDEIKAILAAQDMNARVRAVLALLKKIAEKTANTTDNAAVDFLDRVLSPAVIAVLEQLVAWLLARISAQDSTAYAAAMAEPCVVNMAQVEAAGVPIELLMELARFIAELIAYFRK